MDTETLNINPRRRRVGNNRPNNSNSNSDEIQSYLTNSLENIQFFRARYDEQITEEQRKQLILNELNLVKKEVENKSYETQCKSSWYHLINTISSLIILLSSAIIVGIQAASDCVNIPVIVFSAIIFVVEGVHKMFRWGPLGVLYKHGTVQLKRIARQVRDYMYMFHRYNSDQLLALISQLRSQYDDIDMGLYKTSMAGTARYNTGLDIEEGGGNYIPSSFNNNQGPQGNIQQGNVQQGNVPTGNVSTPVLNNTSKNDPHPSPHVHIHIDHSPNPNSVSTVLPSPYMPERVNSAPILVVNKPSSRLGVLNTERTPNGTPKPTRSSNGPSQNRLKRDSSGPINIPVVNINEDTEDTPPPIDMSEK